MSTLAGFVQKWIKVGVSAAPWKHHTYGSCKHFWT